MLDEGRPDSPSATVAQSENAASPSPEPTSPSTSRLPGLSACTSGAPSAVAASRCDRARATRRAGRRRRADARRARRALPRTPRRHRAPAHDQRAAQAAALRRHGLRRRAAARPRAHERRARRLAGDGCPNARATASRRRSGRRSRPPCAGATCARTRPSSPAATRSRRRGRCAPTPSRSSRRSPPSLSPAYRPLPAFAAATGLRPEEWGALERRDVDRRAGVLTVRRTISSGEVVELGKTQRSAAARCRSDRARDEALDALPPTARHAATCSRPGAAGRSTSPTSAAASGRPAVEASRCPQAGQDLRPALDVRLELARRRRVRVRAGAPDGHVGGDDRAPLRHAARRRRRRHRPPPERCSRPLRSRRADEAFGPLSGQGELATQLRVRLEVPLANQ